MQKAIRIKGAIKRYDVSRGTIYNYVKKGLITPNKITAGCTVYSIAELDKLFGVNQDSEEVA